MTTKPTYADLEQRIRILEETAKGDWMQMALNASVDAIAMSTAEGYHFYQNKSFVRMFGYTPEEVSRLHPHKLYENDCIAKEIFESVTTGSSYHGEIEMVAKNGRHFPVFLKADAIRDEKGDIIGQIAVYTDIFERKQAEQERLVNVHFLKSMDRVNRVIQGTNDLEQMMRNVLNEVLSIIDCDRAWLLYPCDPHTTSWQVPMECTRPGYPGVSTLGTEISMETDAAKTMQIALDSAVPVKLGPGLDYPLPKGATSRGEQSILITAIYPKSGKPWMFGLHQCSYLRVWTPQEEQLFQEIGYRLADGLSSLLIYRELKESVNKYKELADSITDVFFAMDTNLKYTFWNKASEILTGIKAEEAIGKSIFEIFPDIKETKKAAAVYRDVLNKKQPKSIEIEYRFENKYYFFEINAYPTEDGISVYAKDITDRKLAEATLKKSEKQFRTLFESTREGLVSADPDGKVISANPAAAKLLGYKSPKDLIGRQTVEFYQDPKQKDLIMKILVENGYIEDFEIALKKKNGTIAYMLLSITVETDEQGNPLCSNGIFRDITERKEAEQALRKSQASLEASQTLGRMGNWEFYPETKTGFWSKELFRLYDRDPALGVPVLSEFMDMVHPDDRTLIWESHERVMKSGKLSNVVYRTNPTLGEKRYFETTISAIKNSKGDLLYMTGIVQDITERKQAEERVRESEERFRNFLDNLSDAAYETDSSGNVSYVNKAAEMITNRPLKDIIGKPFLPLFTEGSQKIAVNVYQRTLSGESPEYELTFVNGRIGYFKNEPLKDKNGKIIGVFGIARDISDRKRLEEEVLKIEKLESLGILAGGIAHDFNNILTTIFGNISIAKTHVKPEHEIFDLLNEAEMASKRAQALTRQLLTFAKGGAPVRETASIKDNLMESTSFVLKGSKSRCEFSIAEDLWPVDVDVGQMSQVINNIVINANQSMPEGGIIQISAENLIIEDMHVLPISPGRYIQIGIKDQGVGIAEKHLAKIFDPYFTTKQEGSGLGLATTYSIIKKHDGHINVESRLGVGTMFYIYLPASDKKVPERKEIRLVTGQGRILVMDDEAPLRKIVGRILEKLGYESEFAEDGTQAIKMYKEAKKSEKPFDAIILDLTVPGGMGGKETIAKLLEIDPEVKAIVSSGYSDDPVLANFQEYGFKGMMPKPFESLSLGKVLYEVLKGVNRH